MTVKIVTDSSNTMEQDLAQEGKQADIEQDQAHGTGKRSSGRYLPTRRCSQNEVIPS